MILVFLTMLTERVAALSMTKLSHSYAKQAIKSNLVVTLHVLVVQMENGPVNNLAVNVSVSQYAVQTYLGHIKGMHGVNHWVGGSTCY